MIVDVIGLSAERVLSTLGEPTSRLQGNLWPVPRGARNDRGESMIGCLTVQADGEILNIHPFGPRPQRIQLGVPYEVWHYQNIENAGWYLYLTSGGMVAPTPPIDWMWLPARRPDDPSRRNPMTAGRYLRQWATAEGPLIVVERLISPHGAVY